MTIGKVKAICISKRKGERKHSVPSARFVAEFGIEDDAHAGDWHRQVSILALEDIESIKNRGLQDIQAGDFAENVVISGLKLAEVGLGTTLGLGRQTVLRITQIGKKCHTPCRIFHLTGDCIMPRLGLFARVEQGGEVEVGSEVQVSRLVARGCFQAVVITIQNLGAKEDKTGRAATAIATQLKKSLGANIYKYEILPNEHSILVERMKHYCNGHSIDLIVFVGGTGFGARDVAPEAVREVIERFTPGLDERMRAACTLKSPHAALSRSVSGIRGTTLILNVPDTERQATEYLGAIMDSLHYGLSLLRNDNKNREWLNHKVER